MLTQKAMQERKWGSYPALRKALEDKSLPDSYYGPTSVSDNTLDEFRRLIEIAILAHEYESAIKQSASSVGPENFYKDLRELEGRLEGVCTLFQRLAEDIRAISSNL